MKTTLAFFGFFCCLAAVNYPNKAKRKMAIVIANQFVDAFYARYQKLGAVLGAADLSH
jgi:hypothetical protein